MAADLTCDRRFAGCVLDIDRFEPRIAPERLGRLAEGA
jgi:hypothetical protein